MLAHLQAKDKNLIIWQINEFSIKTVFNPSPVVLELFLLHRWQVYYSYFLFAGEKEEERPM